ncbi:DNA topoisomerase I [Monoraphidium neglectum]|uniref:DNA topoisomerase I n=1 Tax=Monoraphidium neglectum TaxID=145388 RepID=A0A0D2NG28_9CHLO|nr:DNA topoisomerase I [Monoraphidium neglectum]KIZ04026.1 DNA topoisomerase I [Monoraphidium neglectum]|eukprot:XP_013903045.1 DNA topoisomerase I [Monoraphidium neglectum]
MRLLPRLPPPVLHSNYSSTGCGYSRPLGGDTAGDYSESSGDAGDGGGGAGATVWNVRQLGRHPETGEQLAVRKGPYGLYVQATGDPSATGASKPPTRNAALPAGATFADVTLESAAAALAGPLPLGPHPEDGEAVKLHSSGRFGPYLQHRTLLASIPKGRLSVHVEFLPGLAS